MILHMDTHEGDPAHPMPDHATLQAWANASLCEHQHNAIHLSISNVMATESQRLNQQFRQKDSPTNVLSFPIQERLDGAYYLGDIVCCGQVIEDESQHTNTHDHWAHMIVHGMLHLQDHTHDDDEDSAIMMAKEIEILNQFGIQNPYPQES